MMSLFKGQTSDVKGLAMAGKGAMRGNVDARTDRASEKALDGRRDRDGHCGAAAHVEVRGARQGVPPAASPGGKTQRRRRRAATRRPSVGVSRGRLPIKHRANRPHRRQWHRGKRLFELTNDSCRWPHGQPGTKAFHFCGAPGADLEGGRPYCERHARRAYVGHRKTAARLPARRIRQSHRPPSCRLA